MKGKYTINKGKEVLQTIETFDVELSTHITRLSLKFGTYPDKKIQDLYDKNPEQFDFVALECVPDAQPPKE